MNRGPEREESQELASQVRGLVLVRSLVLAVLCLLILGAHRADSLPAGVSPGPPLALLGGLWAISLLYWAGFRVGISLGSLLGVQIALELFVETLLVGGTGGLDSPFVVLYFLTIFTAGMFLRRRGAIAAALGATMAFASLALFEGARDGGLTGSRALWEITVHGGVFVVLAWLSGALSERSHRHRKELASKEEELERVMVSTDRIMESMPIGLMTASETGQIVRTNRAAREILGVKPHVNLTGSDLGGFLGCLEPSLVDAMESALLTRKWAIRDEILVQVDGRKRPVGVAVTPLVHQGDVLEGVIVTFTDLTQMRQMEREMRRSEQLANLGELAAGMAHEIRNPLASISGAVQVLQAEFDGAGDEAELMDLIVRESDRLNRTINGMLDYTRDHSLSRDLHDVAALARDVARLVSHDRDLNLGKTILTDFPDGQSFLAEIEEAGMRQVFLNLARNALQAMGVGGILRISGECSGDGRVYIVFRDTGVGIPPHELDNIFKPFHTSKRGGTGLGLSIASRIVDGNGGTIRVKSTPGVGTAFTVDLPAACVPTPPEPEGSDTPDPGSSREGSQPMEEENESARASRTIQNPRVEATR